MAVKRRATEANSSQWHLENELKLFKAALKYKPAGILKHFNMALIYNELVKSGMKDVTPALIWEHLETMYNLNVADKIEQCVPNLEDSEGGSSEFALPKKDFQYIINEMGIFDAGDVAECKEEARKVGASTLSTSSETPKAGSKRPTRSTPGSSAQYKRRK